MKPKYTLIILLLMGCLSIIGQPSKIVSIQGEPQKTPTQVINNQQETILQLQAENDAMQKQLEKIEKEIELYRGDVRIKISELDEEHSRWTAWICLFVTLLAGGLGVAVPLFITNRSDKLLKKSYEKMVEELKTQIESVDKDAKSAKESLTVVTTLKKNIDIIKSEIDKSKRETELAALKTKVNKLFAQAILESKKDVQHSIELFAKVIELDSSNSDAFFMRGKLKHDLRDLDGAMADYNKAIELNLSDAKSYINRGLLKNNNRDYIGAMADYNKAIELSPNNAIAFINRGTLKNDLKDLDGAMADYNKAITLSPNNDDAYCDRGGLLISLEKLDDAMKDINKAIEINPNNAKAFLARGLIKTRRNDKKGAMNDFNKSIDLNPYDGTVYLSRAFLNYDLNNCDDALSDVNKAIELNPNDLTAYIHRATYNTDMKKYDFAMADYSKIIELNPNNAKAYNGRANICLIQKEISKALEDADKAIRLEPANYIFHITKGQIFKSMKMYLEAIYEFSISQSLNEKESKSYSNRSECYRALAEITSDENKKTKFFIKAKEDEKKAESLKNADKA